MAWARVDDGLTFHPKVVAAGNEAVGVWVRLLSYASAHLTDGFIPDDVAKLVQSGGKGLGKLVATGLLTRVENGYQIHDYLEYNPSGAQVKKDREIGKRRSAMNADPDLARQIKARDGDHCRYCGVHVDWRNRRGNNGGTYDHITPVSMGGDESFANIVTACRSCNLKKGARTPELAGMSLAEAPSRNRPETVQKNSQKNSVDYRTPSRPVPSRTHKEEDPPICPPTDSLPVPEVIASPAAPKQTPLDADVGRVVAHYRQVHPERGKHLRPGHEDWRLIAKAVRDRGVGDCILAIDGNLVDRWHAEKRQHSIESIFRKAGKIESFVQTAREGPPLEGSMAALKRGGDAFLNDPDIGFACFEEPKLKLLAGGSK